jgi:ABC-type polysaccharide/polyol phosphate export permease
MIVFSILGTRYKDVAEIVQFVMRISFLATPVIWMPSSEKAQSLGLLLYFNPFYYLLEIVRAPLQGVVPSWEIWAVPLVMLFLGWSLSAVLYRKYASYIPVWL